MQLHSKFMHGGNQNYEILPLYDIHISDWILEHQPNCHTKPIPFYWPS